MPKSIDELTFSTDPNDILYKTNGNSFSDGTVEIDITSISTPTDRKRLSDDELIGKGVEVLSHFNQVLEKKKKDFIEFIKTAEEQDKENKELIELGIEDGEKVSELVYRTEDILKQKRGESIDSDDEIDEVDDMEKEIEKDIAATEVNLDSPVRRVVRRAQVQQEPVQKVEEEVVEEEITEIEEPIKEDPAVVVNTIAEDKQEKEEVEKIVAPVVEEPEEKKIEEDHTPNMVTIHKSVSESDPYKDVKLPDNFSVDEEDFDEEDLDLDKIRDEGYENLQKEVAERLSITSKKIDVSKYKISKKPMSTGLALSKIKKSDDNVHTFNWVAYGAKRPIKMSALTASELYLLDSYDSNRGVVNANTQQAQILYKHDMNPFKGSFETWCKTIYYSDLDHYYACVYAANYTGANYVPYQCSDKKCGHMQLSENIDFMDMVKFKNDTIKKEFMHIRDMIQTKENTTNIDSEIVPISENIAVGFQRPTLYNVLFENASLDDKFREKYLAIAIVVSYIDSLYFRDEETEEFVPIQWKEYPGDVTKNLKSKILTCSKIIDEFTNDEHSTFMAYIKDMNEVVESVSYKIPASKCNKCGKPIEEEETYAKDALFTRRQLGTIVTTSIDS